MDPDLPRAFGFILRADMAGTCAVPCLYGTLVSMPELPRRHDSNYLLIPTVPPQVTAQDIAAEAERIQGAARLGHRCAMIQDADAAERVVPGFQALGWKPFRGSVMALRREPEKRVPEVAIVETDAAALRAAREVEILRYSWGTAEIARQIHGAREFIPVPTRHFAVFENGEPASWTELYVEGDIGQVEGVVTPERFRNRGLASAVVLHAAAAARRAGARLVFLCADAEDWPISLYRHLGFDEIGRYVKFTFICPEESAPRP